MQRLGKNHGGYHGETIDIRAVLREVEMAAKQHGWASETFHTAEEFRWLALRRTPSHHIPCRVPRLYLSAGIHGDEPAGPLAILRLLQENNWPANIDVSLCPCLNPTGFQSNRRENDLHIDLNREYRNPTAEEIRSHMTWLDRQPRFDLAICLHEDWESSGFYLYELNPDQQLSLAETIVQRVTKVCPIDLAELIEGRPAKEGIIRPSFDPTQRPDWPEAFYLITHKTRLSYTLEAPSDFPLKTRVDSLVAAVNAALAAWP